jgi:hypothetical protein
VIQLWDIRYPVRTLAEDIVRIRYKETASEDIEDFMCAAVTVIFRVCRPVRLLWLKSCVYKWSIKQLTIETPSGVTHTRDNIQW